MNRGELTWTPRVTAVQPLDHDEETRLNNEATRLGTTGNRSLTLCILALEDALQAKDRELDGLTETVNILEGKVRDCERNYQN